MRNAANSGNGSGVPKRAEQLLTIPEVAQRLRVSKKSVYRRIQDGAIRAVRVTGKACLRVSSADVDRYLQELRDGR